MEKLAAKAFGRDVGGIFMKNFNRMPPNDRKTINEAMEKLLKTVDAHKIDVAGDTSSMTIERDHEKMAFFEKIDRELLRLNNSDRVLDYLGQLPPDPTRLENINDVIRHDELLRRAEECSDKIDLVIQFKRGHLYSEARELVVHGTTEKFWKNAGLDHRRVNEKIRFYRLMMCFPMLLCLDVKYSEYNKYCADIICRVKLDQKFKDAIQVTNNSMTIGFKEFTLQGISPDFDFDYRVIGKRKFNVLVNDPDVVIEGPQVPTQAPQVLTSDPTQASPRDPTQVLTSVPNQASPRGRGFRGRPRGSRGRGSAITNVASSSSAIQQPQGPPQSPSQFQGPPQSPSQFQGPPQAPQQFQGPPQSPSQFQDPPQAPQQFQGPPQAPQQFQLPPQDDVEGWAALEQFVMDISS